MESYVCNACFLFFRDNSGMVKTTPAAYATYLENANPGGSEAAKAERRVALELLRHLRDGKLVSLHECTSWVREERDLVGLRAGDSHLGKIAKELFDDVAENVEDATVAHFSASELVDLIDPDGRRNYTYLAPRVLSLVHVVQLHINLKEREKQAESRRQ